MRGGERTTVRTGGPTRHESRRASGEFLAQWVGMSEADKSSAAAEQTDATQSTDPKEAMRRALEAKQGKQREGEQHLDGTKVTGGPHGAAAAKRQFRRKSGG